MLLGLVEQALRSFEIFVTIGQSTRRKVIEDLYTQQILSEKLNETLQIFTFPILHLFILLS
jgi:hypothetical protein